MVTGFPMAMGALLDIRIAVIHDLTLPLSVQSVMSPSCFLVI